MRAHNSKRFWLVLTIGLGLLFVAIGFGVNRHLVKIEVDNQAARLALLGTLRRNALLDYFILSLLRLPSGA